MIDSISSLVSALRKMTPLPMLALGICSSLIVFMPNEMAARLGVSEFRVEYRGWLGATVLVAWSYLFAFGLDAFWSWLSRTRNQKKSRLAREDFLRKLTAEEKAYLLPYVVHGVATQNFAVEDGVAGALVRKGILYSAASVFSVLEGRPYGIQPWALEFLQATPSLLNGAGPPPAPPHKRLGGW